MNNAYYEDIFTESMRCANQFVTSHAGALETASKILVSCFQSGRKLLLLGNGGSAADAQHFAAEFVNRLTLNRAAIPAIALTTDSSVMTSIANDFDYQNIFARQIEALGKPGDIVWASSTSGNSPNVINALKVATDTGLKTIASLGNQGGQIADMVDIPLIVDSSSAQRVQEVHLIIGHAICQRVEEVLFKETC